MCDEKECCEKPDQLKGKPQKCTAEQIITFHGDAELHPCVSTKGCHNPARLKDVPETCFTCASSEMPWKHQGASMP